MPARAARPLQSYFPPGAFLGITWLVACPAPSFYFRFPSLSLSRHQLACDLPCSKLFLTLPRLSPGPLKELFPVPRPFQASVCPWSDFAPNFFFTSESAAWAPLKAYFPSLGTFQASVSLWSTLLQAFSHASKTAVRPLKNLFPVLGLSLACGLPCLKLFLMLSSSLKGLFPVPSPFQASVGLWPVLLQAFSYASKTAACPPQRLISPPWAIPGAVSNPAKRNLYPRKKKTLSTQPFYLRKISPFSHTKTSFGNPRKTSKR